MEHFKNEELNLIWFSLQNAQINGENAELMVETKRKLSEEIENRIANNEWTEEVEIEGETTIEPNKNE